MSRKLLDIYTDYLICQTKHVTATGLSDLLEGDLSHDKVTRFLNKNDFGSKELWENVKPHVRKHATLKGGVLILDDCIEEKPYTDENEIICHHFSHTTGKHVKGVNILSCLVRYGDLSFPVGYEIVHKDVEFYDDKAKRLKRKASITKNEHFRSLLDRCHKNEIPFDYILADNWFGSKENFLTIHYDLKKKFIIGIKSNRLVALSQHDRKNGLYQKISELRLQDGEMKEVYLKGVNFPVKLMKKIFTNEDGSTGSRYVVSNDLDKDADYLYDTYKKRWSIEEYHKSIKQNSSLAKSPTKTVKSQGNHIFASILSFCKLELLKIRHATNHFALKYKLIIAANRAAWEATQKLTQGLGLCA